MKIARTDAQITTAVLKLMEYKILFYEHFQRAGMDKASYSANIEVAKAITKYFRTLDLEEIIKEFDKELGIDDL